MLGKTAQNAYLFRRPKTVGFPLGRHGVGFFENFVGNRLAPDFVTGTRFNVNNFVMNKWRVFGSRDGGLASAMGIYTATGKVGAFISPLSAVAFSWAMPQLTQPVAGYPYGDIHLDPTKRYVTTAVFTVDTVNWGGGDYLSLFLECGVGRAGNDCGFEIRITNFGAGGGVASMFLLEPGGSILLGPTAVTLPNGVPFILQSTMRINNLGTRKIDTMLNGVFVQANTTIAASEGSNQMGFGMQDSVSFGGGLQTIVCSGFNFVGNKLAGF